MNAFSVYSNKLLVVGYALLGIGALLFILSVFTIRKKRNTHIVYRGIYGIIRHPMYLGGIIMFFSHFLFAQNWIVAISTTISIVSCYFIINIEDKENIKKYGNAYIKYSESVPKINFIVGILKAIQRDK